MIDISGVNLEVTPSTTIAEAYGARDSLCPPTVTGGPLGESVCPLITYTKSLFGVIVEEPIMSLGGEVIVDICELRTEVMPLITIMEAEGASDSVVLAAVIAGPPAESVCPSITYTKSLLGVIVEEPIMSLGGEVIVDICELSTEVTPSTTIADAERASDSVVPATVIAEPSAESVCPLITYSVSGLAVIREVPKVSTGGEMVIGAARVEVTPLTTMADAAEARESVVPGTVTIDPPGSRV